MRFNESEACLITGLLLTPLAAECVTTELYNIINPMLNWLILMIINMISCSIFSLGQAIILASGRGSSKIL